MAGEELIDEVDRDGRVVAVRPKEDLKRGVFMHNASLVIPMAAGGKFLLSRRAKDKYPYPNTWCCAVGGKARSGETPEQAAEREMVEEVGRAYPVRRVASFVYDQPDYKAVFTVFTTLAPIATNELRLDPEEIQYSRAFELDRIMRMVKDEPESFAPTFISAIREFHKHYGSQQGKQESL